MTNIKEKSTQWQSVPCCRMEGVREIELPHNNKLEGVMNSKSRWLLNKWTLTDTMVNKHSNEKAPDSQDMPRMG